MISIKDKFLSASEAAKLAELSVHTFYRLKYENKGPKSMLESDVRAWIDERAANRKTGGRLPATTKLIGVELSLAHPNVDWFKIRNINLSGFVRESMEKFIKQVEKDNNK